MGGTYTTLTFDDELISLVIVMWVGISSLKLKQRRDATENVFAARLNNNCDEVYGWERRILIINVYRAGDDSLTLLSVLHLWIGYSKYILYSLTYKLLRGGVTSNNV